MAAYFEDEFEEFRARALSGGSLPSITQLQDHKPSATSASGEDCTSGTTLHPMTLSPAGSSPSHAPHASPTKRAPHSATSDPSGDIAHRPPAEANCPRPKMDVPTVVLDGDDSVSEAETETTLLDSVEKCAPPTGGTSSGRPLLSSPRHALHRHSTDGGTGAGSKAGGGGKREMAVGPHRAVTSMKTGERVLSHMAWVMLDDDDWSLGDMRPRVSSMPTQSLRSSPLRQSVQSPLAQLPRDRTASPGGHRVRSFAITAKGVVSKGEVIVPGSSSNSVASNDSESTTQSSTSGDLPSYRVMVSGEAGVGKRALVHSFRCPDHDQIATASFDDDDDADHTVSILLDDEESTLEFIDITKQEMSGSVAEGDCYIVVYSVEWRHSFEVAVDQMRDVRENVDRPVAIILVANKADLVRSRVVGEQEGRSAAKKFDSKYIEVSAAIDHRVDDLLVGILKQIRLTKQKADRLLARARHRRPMNRPEEACCNLLRAQQNMLSKLFRSDIMTSKSCENLYEL